MAGVTKQEKERRDKLAEKGIKVCGTCKKEKPFSEFSKNKHHVYGFNSSCKSCEKQYREDNKERIRNTAAIFRQNNKERIKNYKKKYKQSSYAKEKRKAYNKEYRQRPEVKARQYNLQKEWRNKNPLIRMKRSISRAIRHCFKVKGFSKNSTTQNILGCSYEQLLLWLGDSPSKEYHCDHVIPQSLARTEEELYLLNHYTNLQLLSADENMAKNNHYIRKYNLDRVLAHHPNPDMLKEIINRENIEIKTKQHD